MVFWNFEFVSQMRQKLLKNQIDKASPHSPNLAGLGIKIKVGQRNKTIWHWRGNAVRSGSYHKMRSVAKDDVKLAFLPDLDKFGYHFKALGKAVCPHKFGKLNHDLISKGMHLLLCVEHRKSNLA